MSRTGRGTTADLDRYDLYELCVQAPGDLVALLRAIHGAAPRVLGEDFCGTAAVSAAWVQSRDIARAIAVDHDEEVLARAARHPAIEVVRRDVRAAGPPDDAEPVDVLYAGNYSIGELHDRDTLVAYLRRSRHRLAGGGIFVCDTYGGETAFLTGSTDRQVPLPGGGVVRYVWEQREANPVTGMVVDVLHFEIDDGPGRRRELRDAFVYRWRLWSVPELRDALREAGYAGTSVYTKHPTAEDETGKIFAAPVDGHDLDDTFDVMVVGR